MNLLKQLELDELSLVDRPANAQAKVALFKRDSNEDTMEKAYKMTEEQEKLFGIEKLNVPRSQIPAVTHVDYSARVQTVHPQTNGRYHKLIKRFDEKTGSPVIVNTSFNVNEPICESPKDALECFLKTDMDIVVINDYVLIKNTK